MLIFCDFDGTLFEPDVTNAIWDRYGIPQWRDVLLPPYRAGTLSPVDLMVEGYRAVTVPEAELLAYVRPFVRVRAGFERLQALVEKQGWKFSVLSCGLEFYVRALVPTGMPYHCLASEFDGHWKVGLPPEVTLAPGEDFKVHVMNKLRRQHPAWPTVFIGDGRNDFKPAQAAQHAFAVAGSTLAQLCAEHGTACTEFTDFEEVASALRAME